MGMTYPPGDPGRQTPMQTPPPPQAPAGDAPLQFDRAEFGAAGEGGTPQPAVTTCSACQSQLTSYYAAGEHVVCPPCRDTILASMTGGSGARRFFRALFFGVLAGILGAVVWWGVRKATDAELG